MLGLTFRVPVVEDGVEQYAEATWDGYFSLIQSDWVERAPGSGCGVAFEVDDIDATIAQLRAAGVKAEDAYETPVCKVTSFDDPEGNKVTLHQITVPH